MHADHIKFKYWGLPHSNIIFHSAEIGRRSGAFGIFKNNDVLYDEFRKDLLHFLRSSTSTLFINVTEHKKSNAQNWDTSAVLSRASNHIVRSFILYLLGMKCKGKIVTESATDEQNRFFLQAFTTYLSPGAIKEVHYRKVQEALTSISIVTKNNHDIEEQIADCFAYAARCKYERDYLHATFAPNSYEARLIKVLEMKLFATPRDASAEKKLLFNRITSYKSLIK